MEEPDNDLRDIINAINAIRAVVDGVKWVAMKVRQKFRPNAEKPKELPAPVDN